MAGVILMTSEAPRPWWPYFLWAAVGTLAGLGVVGILSIGIFALGAALLLAVVAVALKPARSAAAVAVVPGLGVLPLLVGLSNLGGPGERCSSSPTSLSCIELLNPWPFLAPALVLLVGGAGLVWWARARTAATRA